MAATALALLQMAALGLWLAAASAAAGPRQTVVDSSDPQGMTISEQQPSEAHEGGEVPVRLEYDDGGAGEEETWRPARDDKRARLLSLEERENDGNAAHGLNVQSRSRAEHREVESATEEEEKEELTKPFVYNIQPLSYYSTETKEQENIINYINRIKEMRENQIKFEAEKKGESGVRQEDAVVTDAGPQEGPVRRRIQHVQIVVGPAVNRETPQTYGQGGAPHAFTDGHYRYPYGNPGAFSPAAADSPYRYPYGHPETFFYRRPEPGPQFDHPNAYRPTVVYVPNVFGPPPAPAAATKGYLDYVNPNYWFNQYFPVVVNNPFDAMQMALSSIVEYGPEADVCRANGGRRVGGGESRRFGIGGGGGWQKGDGEWPKVARVKVRRGGVAIAGPGGIATAGSGGTAIVGPGGTAYTTRDGTAVVGPGGRVVHVPRFPLYADGVDADKGFEPPAGAETVAEGPVVYLDAAESDSQ